MIDVSNRQRDLAHHYSLLCNLVCRSLMARSRFLFHPALHTAPMSNASLPLSPDQSVHQFQTHLLPEESGGQPPHGAVTTFVSAFAASGHGGLLRPNMTAVVDTSFLDNECVPFKVHMPALLTGRCQTPVWEVRVTRSAARPRVHMERMKSLL